MVTAKTSAGVELTFTLPGVALSDKVDDQGLALYNRFSVAQKKKFARDYIDFLKTMEGITYNTYGYIAATSYAQSATSAMGAVGCRRSH